MHDDGWPGRAGWWAAASALALVAASGWLHSPRVEYLVGCTTATALALLATPWLRGVQRRWSLACSALCVAVVVLGLRSQADLHAVRTDWPALRGRLDADGRAALRRELDATARELAGTARRALDAPTDPGAAFGALARLARDGRAERGVVLYRGDSAVAWGGTIRNSPDSLDDPLGVVASPFYLTLYATARRGPARAVAMALLYAAPPADRLARPLASGVAADAGLRGFAFTPPADPGAGPGTLRFAAAGAPLFDVRPVSLGQDELALRVTQRARVVVGIVLLLAVVCFLVAIWRGARRLPWRLGALGAALVCVALVPFNEYSNLTRLFDPALYYTPLGGPLTANAGALGITSALLLLALLAVLRRRRQHLPRLVGLVVVLLVAGVAPFLLRDLARGVNTPSYGVSASLWLMWEIPLFLAATAVMLAGAGAGAAALGRTRGLPPWIAPTLAALAALLAPIVWEAPGQWPWWYTFVWIGAIAALALSRRPRILIFSAATVAALGAATLIWGRSARSRVELAQRDLAGLSTVDPAELALLDRFGASLVGDAAPATRDALLQRYVTSDLAAAGYPTALYAWPSDSAPGAALQTATFPVDTNVVRRLVVEARRTGRPTFGTLVMAPALELALAVPGSGGVTAIVVAPRTHLIANDPFMRLFGVDLEPEVEPPYTLQLGEMVPAARADARMRWRREGSLLHGDFIVRTGAGAARAHVDVELRSLDVLVERGALVVLLDLAIVGALWLLIVLADGSVGRWLRTRRRSWTRSYRTRLTLALFAFFVIPAATFAVWSYRQLANDATQSRELVVREALRAVAPDSGSTWVDRESDELATPLLVYRDGELADASDPLYESVAPVGRFVRPDVVLDLGGRDEETTTADERIGPLEVLFGFRSLDRPGLPSTVIAAPARADETALSRRRRDLGILVLFATAIGALAALWLSGVAARQLERPIGTLRGAALAIARGEREPPLEVQPMREFSPVFTAFRRMAADLNASRTALEEAQRRTAAILRNVASGVVAVDPAGRVSLANPRADALLGAALPPRTDFAAAAPPAVAGTVLAFLHGAADEEAFELEVEQRQLRGQLTRLPRGGAVVTLDDVTDLARAQRVLAWGEMARQIAHEIKNPLTPIRLGVQHLRRARADQRVDFDKVLEQNVERILGEIDRLDEIARAFSRYGSGPGERAPAVPTDVAHVVRDVVNLETMGGEGELHWRLEGADAPVHAWARADELREVLLNVFENARLARARHVRVHLAQQGTDGTRRAMITVADDGHGIPGDVLPRIFEPHFSTRTSGSGLGLAITRQIIDSWGGEVSVASAVGEGTTVVIELRAV